MPKAYKKIDVVGISEKSLSDAIDHAISKASDSLHGLAWFEVAEMRGKIEDGMVEMISGAAQSAMSSAVPLRIVSDPFAMVAHLQPGRRHQRMARGSSGGLTQPGVRHRTSFLAWLRFAAESLNSRAR